MKNIKKKKAGFSPLTIIIALIFATIFGGLILPIFGANAIIGVITSLLYVIGCVMDKYYVDKYDKEGKYGRGYIIVANIIFVLGIIISLVA